MPGDLSVWQIPGADLPSQFFRVLFPTPQIDGGEPAFVPQMGGTTVYVTPTNQQVFVYDYGAQQRKIEVVTLTTESDLRLSRGQTIGVGIGIGIGIEFA